MFGYYLNLALRSLKRNKMLTALMVLAIAVGIGASMTTLTVMHLLSGDPLPGKSGRIFYPQVDARPGDKAGDAPLDMLDYRSAMDLWRAGRGNRQALIANSPVKIDVARSTRPPLMRSLLSTTADFFPMFDVPFAYGHPWSAADDADRARVVVISSQLNERLFGGEDSVGKTLRVRGTGLRIVGVLAPWRPSPKFYDVRGGRFASGQTSWFYGPPEDVLMPFETSLEVNDGHFQQFTCWSMPEVAGHLVDSSCVWVGLWVQLDTPAAVADYRRFLSHYAAEQKALGRFSTTHVRLMDLMQWLDFNRVVPSDVALQTWLAFAFLLICLFNTVGLLLAKFMRRSGEIGVRRAIGATRGDVFTQCLIEAGMVGLLGGIGGFVLTQIGLWLVRRQPVEYADMAHMDTGMFLMTFALAVVSSLVAGALPALRACRVTPALQLKTL